ncbi:MAG: hypothetical protein [Microvirus sp.]|nr:MAG: hypothetical protein [Microvirus sp.]
MFLCCAAFQAAQLVFVLRSFSSCAACFCAAQLFKLRSLFLCCAAFQAAQLVFFIFHFFYFFIFCLFRYFCRVRVLRARGSRFVFAFYASVLAVGQSPEALLLPLGCGL